MLAFTVAAALAAAASGALGAWSDIPHPATEYGAFVNLGAELPGQPDFALWYNLETTTEAQDTLSVQLLFPVEYWAAFGHVRPGSGGGVDGVLAYGAEQGTELYGSVVRDMFVNGVAGFGQASPVFNTSSCVAGAAAQAGVICEDVRATVCQDNLFAITYTTAPSVNVANPQVYSVASFKRQVTYSLDTTCDSTFTPTMLANFTWALGNFSVTPVVTTVSDAEPDNFIGGADAQLSFAPTAPSAPVFSSEPPKTAGDLDARGGAVAGLCIGLILGLCIVTGGAMALVHFVLDD